MSIYKRASGKWAVLVEDPSATNERRRKSLGTFATRKDAERAERDMLSAKDRGIDLTPSRVTMDALFERFMLDAEARNLSGTTLYGYRACWNRCAPIAKLPVERLKPAHLADLFTALGSSPKSLAARTIGHTHALIKTLLAWAMRLELIGRNVAEIVEPPRGARRKSRPYEHGEAARFIEEASRTRLGPAIIVAFTTGLRRGELAGLRWDDIDLERKVATIRGAVAQIPGRVWYKPTKTDLVATIALSPAAIDALRAQRAQQAADKLRAGGYYVDEGFVFAGELGGRPTPGALGQAIRRIARRAGLSQIGVHAIRHSTGSWLIRAGVDVRTVAAVLRHSATSTTLNVYAHEIEGAQAAAVSHLDAHLLPSHGNRLATAVTPEKERAI